MTWSSNTEPDIAGYRLYYSTHSGSYTTYTDVGPNIVYSLQGLQQGTYYFVITAYNQSGIESGYSNEVEYSVPAPPSVPDPPVVNSISDTKGPAGMEVTISGDNLVKGTQIDFNGMPASIVLLDPKKVTVAVPRDFSSGPVTVTTPGGSVIAGDFTATPAQSGAGLNVSAGDTLEYSTIGPSSNFQTGYATVKTNGATTPTAIAFLTYSQDGVESSVVGLTASTLTSSARILIDHRLRIPSAGGTVDVKTGFSVVNPGTDVASLEFILRNQNGSCIQTGTWNLAKEERIVKFLDDFFTMSDRFGLGSLEIRSSQPVSIFALRLIVNQSGKLLLSSIPVVDTTKPAVSSPLYFPRMNTGGGFQTSVLLLNTSDQVQTGRIVLLSPSGTIFSTRNPSGTPVMSPYRILPGGVFRMATPSDGDAETGWIRVLPDWNSETPAGAEIIGFSQNGLLTSETCFGSASPTNRALVYVDQSKDHLTSLAVANPGLSALHVDIRTSQKDVQTSSLEVPGNGTAGGDIQNLFGQIPEGFKGVLELRSTDPFLAAGLSSFTNSEGDMIFSSVPVMDPEQTAPLQTVFPQVSDGNGYQTDFILVSSDQDDGSVQLDFWDEEGNPIAIGR